MNIHVETSAMYDNFEKGSYNAREDQNSGRMGGRKFNNEKEKVICSHCHLPGHTKERCYKIIGYPSSFKNKERNGGQNKGPNRYVANNLTASSSDNNTGTKFTNEQLGQMLSKLLLKSENGQQSSSNIERTDEMEEAHMAGTINNNTTINKDRCWVIDSGATSHFCYNSEMLQNISRIENPYTVRLTNGEKLTIRYIGSCTLSDDIILVDVLYASEFTVNLISVSKLI